MRPRSWSRRRGRLIDPELSRRALAPAAMPRTPRSRDPQPGNDADRRPSAWPRRSGERLDHWREHHSLDNEATDAEQNALLAEMMATALSPARRPSATRRSSSTSSPSTASSTPARSASSCIVRGLRRRAGRRAGAAPRDPPLRAGAHARRPPRRPTYRWCTNFIVTGEALDGDSFVPALESSATRSSSSATRRPSRSTSTPTTTRPRRRFSTSAGEIVQEDIADMREQIAEREARLGGRALGRSSPSPAATGCKQDVRGPRGDRRGRGRDAQSVDPRPGRGHRARAGRRGRAAAELSERTDGRRRRPPSWPRREVAIVDCDTQQAALAALPEARRRRRGAPRTRSARQQALARIRAGGVAEAVKDDVRAASSAATRSASPVTRSSPGAARHDLAPDARAARRAAPSWSRSSPRRGPDPRRRALRRPRGWRRGRGPPGRPARLVVADHRRVEEDSRTQMEPPEKDRPAGRRRLPGGDHEGRLPVGHQLGSDRIEVGRVPGGVQGLRPRGGGGIRRRRHRRACEGRPDHSQSPQDRRDGRERAHAHRARGRARRLRRVPGAFDDFEAKSADFCKRFKFIGDFGAFYFLYVVGEDVPEYNDWRRSRGLEPLEH